MDLLIIAPNDYDSLVRKGVLYQYENYREGGYFRRVISLFPFTRETMTKEEDENKIFFQYGWKSGLAKLDRFKVMKLFGSLGILFRLAFVFPFVLRKYDIRVIRASDPYLSGLAGWYYSRLLRIPLVISVHSDYDLGDESGGFTFKIFGSRKLAKKIEHFVYRKSQAIWPISEYLIERIRTSYDDLAAEKFSTFPHGIDVSFFDDIEEVDIRQEFGISPDHSLISYVARLSKEKNCLDLPLIARELRKFTEDFTILVIGSGKEFETIREMSRRYGLERHIVMAGHQGREIVFSARKSADVNLCLLDGFSLIEAGLGGRPLVAYDTEWHSELVRDGETGLLVPVNDYRKAAEAIMRFLEDPELAESCGKKLRELTIEKHEISNTQKKKRALYTKVIEESER